MCACSELLPKIEKYHCKVSSMQQVALFCRQDFEDEAHRLLSGSPRRRYCVNGSIYSLQACYSGGVTFDNFPGLFLPGAFPLSRACAALRSGAYPIQSAAALSLDLLSASMHHKPRQRATRLESCQSCEWEGRGWRCRWQALQATLVSQMRSV